MGIKGIWENSETRVSRESFISDLSKGKFLAPIDFKGICNTELFDIWLRQVLICFLFPYKKNTFWKPYKLPFLFYLSSWGDALGCCN